LAPESPYPGGFCPRDQFGVVVKGKKLIKRERSLIVDVEFKRFTEKEIKFVMFMKSEAKELGKGAPSNGSAPDKTSSFSTWHTVGALLAPTKPSSYVIHPLPLTWNTPGCHPGRL
jgi:hypothetical protein